MKSKKLIIIKGKGTKAEKKVITNIDLYWSNKLKKWVSVPE
jgi:hypothetical protein